MINDRSRWRDTKDTEFWSWDRLELVSGCRCRESDTKGMNRIRGRLCILAIQVEILSGMANSGREMHGYK